MAIVCKFGGTSTKDGPTLEHIIGNIILANPERRIAVFSAQAGVTTQLIETGEYTFAHSENTLWMLKTFEERSIASARHFGLRTDFLAPHFKAMERALLNRVQDEYMYLDGFISYGEIINSHIATAALRKNGANARLYMPGDIGAVTDGKFGQARLLPSSYDSMKTALRAALARDELIVLPGFFAVDSLDRFTTLGRGASDIIGSHVAHAVDAEIYENWTDQNGILTAHPDVVENPQTIGRLTYREARELAISGAKILHQDTLSPLISKGIPLNVRNTFNPPHSGTYIGPTKEPNGHVVEGIAHKTDFAVIYLEKIGIEGEVGYLSRVTDIFARHGLPIERSPDSSDSLALIVPQNKGANKYKIKAVVREIEENGLVDSEVNVQYDRGLICVVGEGMRYASGVLAKVTGALASAGINIETCIQGPSQRNITLGLHPNDVHRAVRAIHNAYFGNSRQPQYAAQHAAI